MAPRRMANVLSDERKQQVIALGRLGWPLRRIEEATGVRRETASSYLKAAGVAVRPPRGHELPAKPASEVSTDPGGGAKPASEVSTDSTGPPPWTRTPGRAPAASACEPFRELVEQGLRLR